MANNPSFATGINNGYVKIEPADTTTIKTLITAGANGTRIMAINITSNDASNRIVAFYIKRSSVNYRIGSLNVTAGSGVGGVVSMSPMSNIKLAKNILGTSDPVYIFDIESGDELTCQTTTTVETAKEVIVSCWAKDF